MSTQIRPIPSFLNIRLAPEILNVFPNAKVAVLMIKVPVFSKDQQPKEMQKYLSALKQSSVKQIVDFGITSDNYLETRVCQSWASTFESFNAGAEKQSTIVNLLRRAAAEGKKIREGKKADMGNISNFVDYYNCMAVSTMTPMGATDITKISQRDGIANMQLRFARAQESFIPLGKTQEVVALTEQSAVYADDEKILTGFWNWRDSKDCCVVGSSQPDQEEHILLVADQVEQDPEARLKPINERPGDVEEAISRSMENLGNIGGQWVAMDILSKDRPEVSFDMTRIEDGEVTVTPQIN